MKTENELNDAILKVTMKIRDNYPELSKYITEMPVTIPDEKDPHVGLKNLQDYFDSLNELLKKYDEEHTNKLNN